MPSVREIHPEDRASLESHDSGISTVPAMMLAWPAQQVIDGCLSKKGHMLGNYRNIAIISCDHVYLFNMGHIYTPPDDVGGCIELVIIASLDEVMRSIMFYWPPS